MSLKWVNNEVALACKKENPNWDGKTFDYGIACYQSALSAYVSLHKEGHSGTSWNITKNILIRLLNNLPLTPINDEDFFIQFEDNFPPESDPVYLKEHGLKSQKQCQRMSSLFREEDLDGNITYSDVSRSYCININNPNDTFSGCEKGIIDELFPITMPYYPSVNKYKVYVENFLTDTKNGDFDVQGFFYCITPEGDRVEINRFFKEKNHKMVEISKDEYLSLKAKKIK